MPIWWRSVTRNKYQLRASSLVQSAAGKKVAFSLILAAIAVTLLSSSTGVPNAAYADGLFMEQFNASLKGRDARLAVSVNPPILTSETLQDAYVQFRLFDANTNGTIKFSTFAITIEKGAGENAMLLLRDVFHTESGLLTLKMQPKEGPVTILGTQEQFINAWVADPGGTINIRGPILLEGGLYHFGIEILGIDSIRSLFPPADITRFDSWLSVGDVFSQSVDFDGQSYNTTIISYYDRVQDFSFDAAGKTFSWAMPFDWNTSRIDLTTIFVHEEVKIPKSMAGIGDSVSFQAKVNDIPVTGSQIVVDPYSSQSEVILHYLLNKPQILSVAGQVPDGTEKMTFDLTPTSAAEPETTTEMSTDTGGIQVALQWTPNPLDAEQESIVTTTFSDAFSGRPLDNRDVIYDMRIIDFDGNSVYEIKDITASGGTDTQTIDFPSNANYRIEIQVKGLVEDGRPVDGTRNGIARGIVVVPEFPAGPVLAISMFLISVIAVQRLAKRGLPSFKGMK